MLLEEFERNGIRVEQFEGEHTLSKGSGSVFFGMKENTESGYVYQTVVKSPISFSSNVTFQTASGGNGYKPRYTLALDKK